MTSMLSMARFWWGVASLFLLFLGAAPPEDGRLFFLAISGGGRVLSANVDGTDVKVVSKSRAAGPDGVAVDEASGHLYWTNMGAVGANDGTIERSDLDG